MPTNPRWTPTWPDVVGLMVHGKKPRTVREIMELTGAKENTIDTIFMLLREEGLIVPAGHREKADPSTRGHQALEWRWVG
jgi:hypothetical protein